jgi:hypothetical protein
MQSALTGRRAAQYARPSPAVADADGEDASEVARSVVSTSISRWLSARSAAPRLSVNGMARGKCLKRTQQSVSSVCSTSLTSGRPVVPKRELLWQPVQFSGATLVLDILGEGARHSVLISMRPMIVRSASVFSRAGRNLVRHCYLGVDQETRSGTPPPRSS